MNISKQAVILSAEQASNRVEKNRQLTENLRNCLIDCNFNFKEAQGVYKNDFEDSFVVIVKNQADIDTLKDFAFKNFNQESILHVDSNQEAYLVYPDKEERLGILEQVSKEVAESRDSYTVLHGKYYVTNRR